MSDEEDYEEETEEEVDEEEEHEMESKIKALEAMRGPAMLSGRPVVVMVMVMRDGSWSRLGDGRLP